jgi:hypothetical protein
MAPPIFVDIIILMYDIKKRGYAISKAGDEGHPVDIDLTEYLKDMFSSYYAAFLLNFGMSELLEALG